MAVRRIETESEVCFNEKILTNTPNVFVKIFTDMVAE
jgi:hypothetical protein